MSEHFSAFSGMHALVLVVSLLGWAMLLRAAAGRSIEQRWNLVIWLAISTLVLNFLWFFYKFRHENFNIDSSLPLHLCDFAWMVAVWALLAHENDESPAHQLVFFWGLGLSTQAFFTPTLDLGVAHPRFWSFWLSHWQIVAVGLLDVLVYRRRPDARGLVLAILTTFVLGLAVTLFNLKFETPYFFTGRGSPGTRTIIDQLGPWPGRLATMGLVVACWFSILYLAFRRRPRRSQT